MPAQIITNTVYSSLRRQVIHWQQATSRLSNLEHSASSTAWHGIDYNLGSILQKALKGSIDKLDTTAKKVVSELDSVTDEASLRRLKREVLDLRDQYLRAEETIHFYTVAINSRTTPGIAALLRACDILCVKSMQELLQTLERPTPHVLTYIDKGVGASILRAGLRLWDGNVSPIAAIKVTQHNLFRPTAIIHETGHQVSFMLGWNDELAKEFESNLSRHPGVVGSAFASWASEIAADAFAFVHTGYASVSALHDVVSGSPAAVFTYRVGDPHPISYLRVLLGIEMCRQFYGAGPWDQLEVSFKNDYDINLVSYPSIELINASLPALPEIVQIILRSPYRAFQGKSLSQIIQPQKVSPQELQRLEYVAGPSLFTSHAWIWKECIKLLALNGYKIALGQGDLGSFYKLQEEWMTRLGFAVELN